MLLEIDERKIIPDPVTLDQDGAISSKEGSENWRVKQIHTLAAHYKFKLTTPWDKLPGSAQLHPLRLGRQDQVRVPGQRQLLSLQRDVRRPRADAPAPL